MSVIYRSLEQLRRKKATEGPARPRPAAKAPSEASRGKAGKGRRKLILICAGGFVLLGILAMASVYLMQDQIETMVASPSTPAASEDALRAAKLDVLKKKAEEKRAEALAAAREAAQKARGQLEEERLAAEAAAQEQKPSSSQNTVASGTGSNGHAAANAKKPTPEQLNALIEETDAAVPRNGADASMATQPTDGLHQTDSAKKKWALENHFTSQAERNMHIRSLETEVAQAAKTEGAARAREGLDKLVLTVGEDSLAATKWRGYLALKEKNYETAETFYRQALLRSPSDLDSRYNLILALFMQQKLTTAKEVYGTLLTLYPLDDKVQAMGRMLGLR